MKIQTYRETCADDFNPFSSIPDVSAYGSTAELYQKYMLLYHGDLPVTIYATTLYYQILMVFEMNRPKYQMLYRAQQNVTAVNFNPLTDMHYTDTMVHTGQDSTAHTGTVTNARTGSVADSGTDSTTNSNTVTDSATTYDSTTENETGKSVSSGGGSITHGKTTTYNNVTDTQTLGNTETTTRGTSDTRTVDGYKNNPAKNIDEITGITWVFQEIIRDVVNAISCIIYIPKKPEEMEENVL